jgi:methylthioribose-1-phosphate isomerase
MGVSIGHMAILRTPGSQVVALRFEKDTLWALDQTALPFEERELALRTPEEVAAAIRRLSIRGAPLIGVAAAYGVALGAARDPTPDGITAACAVLRDARPTAVNLAWAVDRVRAAVLADGPGEALAEARRIHDEELAASREMGAAGADLLAGARRVLTHCNTGALAAPGDGTALAVVAEMARRGTLEGVVATESRPLLQGARLTVYELGKLGIPHELIVDSAAAGLVAGGAIDAVVLGADRIAGNGDVANKVGTLSHALAARHAGIPFVVVAPTSTIDLACPSGREITIEERAADEVTEIGGRSLTIAGTRVRNPAFDVTPSELVSAIVTERGVALPPAPQTLAALCSQSA